MLELNLQLFGGRGGSSGKSSSNSYESGNMTESEFESFISGRQTEFDNWIDSKTKDSLELDGFIFEKYSQKDLISYMKDSAWEDNIMSRDNMFSITYKDGKTLVIGEGDSIKGVKTSNIDSIIWDNGSTIGIYGKNVSLESLTDYKDYKKGHSPLWGVY